MDLRWIFFKFFWIDLGRFIQRSLNFAYQSGSLSVTQKQGITCLPKPNKQRDNLKKTGDLFHF